jgi:hypothetical protein
MLLANRLDTEGGFPVPGRWVHHLVGAAFGALVLGPYAARDHRALRIAMLAAAGAAIYYLAVWFVIHGPIGFDAVTSFVIAGSGAALLSALAVIAIAPQPFAWRLAWLTLAAGAIGGAAFELRIIPDPILLAGHAAWQFLVCLALHAGLRGPTIRAVPA